MNLYEYVGSAPLVRSDPYGWLWGSKKKKKEWEKKCADWIANELKDMGWLKGLPACSCYICKKGKNKWANPDEKTWRTPSKASKKYHPGATACMRSKVETKGNPGQQCCYDAKGKLITGGLGAGTPDKVSPDADWWGHFKADVEMFNDCKKWLGTNWVLSQYLKVRPVNNNNGCPGNVI